MSKGNPFFNIIPIYVICQNSLWICSRKSAASNTNVYIDFSSNCNFRASFCSTFILAHNILDNSNERICCWKNSLLVITPVVASPLQKKAPPDLQRPGHPGSSLAYQATHHSYALAPILQTLPYHLIIR